MRVPWGAMGGAVVVQLVGRWSKRVQNWTHFLTSFSQKTAAAQAMGPQNRSRNGSKNEHPLEGVPGGPKTGPKTDHFLTRFLQKTAVAQAMPLQKWFRNGSRNGPLPDHLPSNGSNRVPKWVHFLTPFWSKDGRRGPRLGSRSGSKSGPFSAKSGPFLDHFLRAF